MCQEPTELLWIGFLTGLILILKFRFDTLIPNINSQTFWPEGNFTRDEWNNLLHLFNISHFSSTRCAENSSLISCPNTMAKRMQEQKGERRIVAKSNSTAMNLSSHVPASSSTAESPIASQSQGMLIATGNAESRMRRNSKSDAASSSQVRLQDAYLGWLMDTATEKLVATKAESGDVDLSESETLEFSRRHSDWETHCFLKGLGETRCIQKIRPPRKSKRWENTIATQSTHVSSDSSSHGSSLLDRQENLRTRTWWPYGWSGREYGYLGQISEYHSSSSSSSWTRLWGEFTIREESSLD